MGIELGSMKIVNTSAADVVKDEYFDYARKVTDYEVQVDTSFKALVQGTLTEITTNMLKDVNKIAAYAFYGSKILSVTIPDNVLDIETYAFANCEYLYNVKLNTSISTIKRSVFDSCSNLMNITIPANVTTIEVVAFRNCYKLVEVYNLSNLDIQVGATTNGNVARNALNVYTPESGSSKLSIVDKYCFYEDGDTVYLIGYTDKNDALTLPTKSPSGKKYQIYQFAFAYTDLKSVIIGNGATSINIHAFESCSSLENVIIGNDVTTISDHAFTNANHIKKLVIGENVTNIGGNAFLLLFYDEDLVIPAKVTNIGSSAFANSRKLPTVIFKGQPIFSSYIFNNCSSITKYDLRNATSVPTLPNVASLGHASGCQIIVPDSLYDDWKQATNWSALTDVVWVKASEYVEA